MNILVDPILFARRKVCKEAKFFGAISALYSYPRTDGEIEMWPTGARADKAASLAYLGPLGPRGRKREVELKGARGGRGGMEEG